MNKSKKNIILCATILFTFIFSFGTTALQNINFQFNESETIIVEKESSEEKFKTQTEDSEPSSNEEEVRNETIFGDLSDSPEDPELQLAYYKDKVLQEFNLSYSDYYSLSEEDSEIIDNYIYALWGYDNGSLTEEMVLNMTKHNSPLISFNNGWSGYPTKNDVIYNNDRRFRLRFHVEPRAGERIRRVHAILDRDESLKWGLFPEINSGSLYTLKLREEYDPYHEGYISGSDWVGTSYWHWGYGGVLLDATFNPHFVDNWVEVWIRVTWDARNFWGRWVRQDDYYKVVRKVVKTFSIFGLRYVPLAIVDDDSDIPELKASIVDVEDMVSSPFGYKVYPDDAPPQIKEGKEYKYSDDQFIFFQVNDKSSDCRIHLDIKPELGEIETEVIHVENDASPYTVNELVPFWGYLLDNEIEKKGCWMNLSELQGGIRWDITVWVDDRDNDRENDNLLSEKLNFILYSEASESGASINPNGAGNIIQDVNGIDLDEDFYYEEWGEEGIYEVLPYKKDFTPSELTFNITFYNDFDIPLRILLNYTQFENNHRLTTFFNTSKFNIIANGTDGRTNYYEGFTDSDPLLVEENNFSEYIDVDILYGGLGSTAVWLEILPGEEVILEDFLTIYVDEFELLSSLSDDYLSTNIQQMLDSAKELFSTPVDFMSWSVPDVNFSNLGIEYKTDDKFNLFNILVNNPVLLNFIAKSQFGIRAEKVYYPKYYLPDSNQVLWSSENTLEERDVLNLIVRLHNESSDLGYHFEEETGFNRFSYAFIPNDEQLNAYNLFLHQLTLRDSLLYLSSYCENSISSPDPTTEQLMKLTKAIASGINSLIYPLRDIADGNPGIGGDYLSKPSPLLMTPSLDLFPELAENDELALIGMELINSAFFIERELAGFLESMSRYNLASKNQYPFGATQQLQYATTFMKNATFLYGDFTLHLSKFLVVINDILREKALNPFSNEAIELVRENFVLNHNYYQETIRQSNFRNNDANYNILIHTTQLTIQNNENATIREILLDRINSAPFSSMANELFLNLEKTLVSDYVRIQKEVFGNPVISNTDTALDLSYIEDKIQEGVDSFHMGYYENCINLMDQVIGMAINNYRDTLDQEFLILYLKAVRLMQKAQKYNQIRVEVLDSRIKEVKNGNSVEFVLQLHNDLNYGMNYSREIIAPLLETLNLPTDVTYRFLYLNNTILLGDPLNNSYIRLEAEEYRIFKLVVDIPLNSPHELTTLSFTTRFSQALEFKSIAVQESFEINVLEDDTTAPIILLSYSGDETDGNPGYLNIEIIEDDLGSEATGVLNITGPNNYKCLKNLTEDSITIDLKEIGIYTPGYYSIHIYAENNDEDRGAIDEESDTHYSSIYLTDDDTTAPLLDLSYDGIGTDQDPGMLEFSITENDEGSEATATLSITGPMNFEFIQYYSEGEYQIDLSAISSVYLGTYDVSLYAENNDEDGWEGDEESDIIFLSYTIIDDDVDSPEVTIEIYDYDWEVEGELIALPINVTAVDYSGISKVEISMGSYYSDELGYQIILLPEGIYTLEVVVTDNDNDRPGDMLSTTKTVEIILDLTPPTTELVMDPFYDDGLGNYFVTSATCFSFEAFDEISGVDFTKYRILGETEWRFAELFTLSGYTDGIYVIEFYSVDNVGNVETVKSVEVNLVSIKTESYLSDEVNRISSFDLVFRKYKNLGYMLTATNPGQIFYNVELYHNWPIPIEYLEVDMAIPSDFVTQGTNPIHIYMDGEDITEFSIIDGFSVKIFDIAPGSVITIIVHMDYGLKGTIFESLDDVGINRYSFESIITAGGGEIEISDNSLFEVQETDTEIYSILKGTTAIAGCITDEYGIPLQGFEIVLTDAYGNIIATTFTDENGFYYFNNIDPGNYIIEVRFNGVLIESRNVYATAKELTEVDFKKSW